MAASLSNLFHCWNSVVESPIFQLFLVPAALFGIWKFIVSIYHVATTDSGIHFVQEERKQRIDTFKFYNPFSMTADFANASVRDGIKITLKTKQSCILRTMWGVPVDNLMDFIRIPPPAIRTALIAPCSEFFRTCRYYNISHLMKKNEEKELLLQLSPSENMGGNHLSSRVKRFPLVIFMILIKQAEDKCKNAVIAVAYVIHLKDENYPFDSQLIDQYARLSNGQVTRLKKLYGDSTEINGEDRTNNCIACYERPSSIVLLPCRHACVCDACYKHCDKCPMCRGFTPYYYKLQLDS